jgi:MFS family permease
MSRSPLFRDGPFVRLWGSNAAAGMATWGLPFVLGLAVLDRTITASELGAVLAVRTIGYLVAIPFGGLLADRLSSRRVIALAGVPGAAGPALMAAGLGGATRLAAVGAALAGAGQGVARPAFQAFVAEVVPPARRQEANAAISWAVQGTALVPPAVASVASAFVGPQGLLVATGALWLGAAALPPRGRQRPGAAGGAGDSRPSYLDDLVAGAREARRHPWFLGGLAALVMVVATGFAATGVVLPLVSRERYGSERVMAAATSAYTIGALAGAGLMARWRPRSSGWVALGGLAGYGLAPLCLLLPLHPAVLVLGYAGAGVGVEVFNVPWFTATQREVDPELLARVSALDFLVTHGLSPVGLALIAPAIDSFGEAAVLASCTLACVAAPALAALIPSTRGFSTERGTDRSARPTTTTSLEGTSLGSGAHRGEAGDG